MGRAFEMFGGMAIGRTVATADMTTGQAETEMHPGRSTVQTFFTTSRASRHGLNRRYVWAGHESPPGHSEEPPHGPIRYSIRKGCASLSTKAVLAKILSVLTRDWQTVNPEGDQ